VSEEGSTWKNAELEAKYAGKSAEDLAEMHSALEQRLGTQGEELGALRASLDRLTQQLTQGAGRTEPAEGRTPKGRYAKYADKLILDPAATLDEVAAEIKNEVRTELTNGMSQAENYRRITDDFMRNNPELVKVREIFGEIGDRLYRANPQADYGQILEEARKRTTTYLQELRKRGVIVGADSSSPRKNDGITTSGGRTRDTAPAGGGDEGDGAASPDDAVLKEIASIKSWRDKRSSFRRSSK